MRVKSSGMAPGVGKCPAPGQCKICKCPIPGTDKAGKFPAVAGGGGGWAQVELTDALASRMIFIICLAACNCTPRQVSRYSQDELSGLFITTASFSTAQSVVKHCLECSI